MMGWMEIRLNFGVLGLRLVDVHYVAERNGYSNAISYSIHRVLFGMHDILESLPEETISMLYAEIKHEVEESDC